MGLWILVAVQLALTIVVLVAVLLGLAWARAAAKEGRETRWLLETFLASFRQTRVHTSPTTEHPRAEPIARMSAGYLGTVDTGANDCEEPAPVSGRRVVQVKQRKFSVLTGKRQHDVLPADRVLPVDPRDFYPLARQALKRYRHGIASDEKRDICQDVVFAAWKRRDKYDPSKGTVKQWFSGIVLNCVREYSRAVPQEALGMQLEGVIGASAVYSDQRTAIQRALLELPELDRKIVVYYTVEGMTLEEIAKEVNVSLTTVHRRYTSSIARLRAMLDVE